MIAAVTLTIGWINLRGIRQSAFVINLLTIAKLVPLALFIVVGWWFIDANRLAPSGPVSLTHLSTGAAPANRRLRRLRRHPRSSR